MKFKFFTLALLLVASAVLVAQSSNLVSESPDSDALGGGAVRGHASSPRYAERPFSKIGVGVGVSPLGAQVAITTDLNQHFNVRATGNMFSYSTTFTESGISANAKLALKSAGVSLDIYPFHSGFRLSPGVLFYNTNQLTATGNTPAGTSFTLNNQTYYSAKGNASTGATPVSGNALLSLHPTSPAFTITTGWGNTVPKNGHWSFPFELGVALTGAPALNVNLGGWACYDQAQTLCTNINSKTDPIALQIQSNLHAQLAKWNRDIEPLKTYPIVSFGVAYSFNVGRSQGR